MAFRLKRAVISSVGLIGALFLVLLLGGIGVGYFSASGAIGQDQGLLVVMAAVGVVLMIGALWISAQWMRSIDEAAREAHKSAWFWGGSTGMAFGGIFIILAGLPQAATLEFAPGVGGRTDPAHYMAAGAMGILLFMLAGYAIVWAWWWLARMRG